MGLPRKMSNAGFALDVDHAPHRGIWFLRFDNRNKLKTIIGPRTDASVANDGGTILSESTVSVGRRARLVRYTFEILADGIKAVEANAGCLPADLPPERVGPELSAAQRPAEPAAVESSASAPSESAPDAVPVSQRAAGPAAPNARTMPISAEEQRGLRAEARAEADRAMPTEGESRLEVRPLDANKATVPVSTAKVRKIPRRDRPGNEQNPE